MMIIISMAECFLSSWTQSTRAYFGRVGGIWGTYDDDGDLTQIFHDSAGYVTGQVNSYLVRRDNLLMQKADGSCVTDDVMNAAICNGVQYGQVSAIEMCRWPRS